MAEGVFAWKELELPTENSEAGDRDILGLNYWLADRLGYTLAVDDSYDRVLSRITITDPKGESKAFNWARGKTWEQMMYHAMCLGHIPWVTHDLNEALALAANYPNIRLETGKFGDKPSCWTVACWDEEISEGALYQERQVDLRDLPVHIVRCILALTDYRVDFDRPYPPIYSTITYGSTK